jgi:hypothetical protein
MLVHLLHAMEGGRCGAVNVPKTDSEGRLSGFDRFTADDVRAELARLRGEAAVRPVEKDDEKICTFCARGQPAFYLQSGTGNLWHRNEAGQLYKCLAQIAKSATVRVEE